MITITFYGYTVYADTLRKSQMILALATRVARDGDIDAWYHAGCPIGRGYAKWVKTAERLLSD